MNRRTLIAGAVFAALAVFTVLFMRTPEKGQRTGEATRPLATMVLVGVHP